MLTKRTNILFDENTFSMLTYLAKQEEVSVGELVRRAVKKNYLDKKIKLQRKKAIDDILKIRKRQTAKIDYRALVENGRKY